MGINAMKATNDFFHRLDQFLDKKYLKIFNILLFFRYSKKQIYLEKVEREERLKAEERLRSLHGADTVYNVSRYDYFIFR